MRNLREYNEEILNTYYKLDNYNDLAMPLLVSSKNDYFNSFERKILYIGQENNSWLNYDGENKSFCVDDVEQAYLNFLSEGANNKEFWTFIRNCLEISKEKLLTNVIWNNTVICGKRMGIGHPKMNEKLEKISTQYLIYLYEYFKPEYTIFVNGPSNPYYNIMQEVLKNINSDLCNMWPTGKNPILYDCDKKIIWTYHPNYLNRSHLKEESLNKIKKIVR